MSRRKPAAGPTISLFPFLAVLLCTMGALLVLLVLFSRSASRAGQQAAVAAVEELELAVENARWRREQLAGVRARTGDDLSRARMVLAGVEENTRELEDELDRLVRTVEALEGEASVAAEEDLADLERRLTNARESLDTARDDLAKRPPAYAVVPYVGKHGTHRRPLYIECCIDGVFLQPEGIRLQPGDFDGPPGPGNPLASALRAAREQIARAPSSSGDPAAQPYPLLLVRPSGVMAYYAAREAIASWGNEFGYQLIEDDWEIAYPPADPSIAEAENRAIEESRRRLQWLAEAHPQRPARPSRQYRAAPTRGGVVENGAPSVLGDQSQWEWKEQGGGPPAPGRGRSGGFGTSTGGGGNAAGLAGGGASGGSGAVSGGTVGGPAGSGAGTGGGGSGGGDGVGPGRPFMAAADGESSGDAILGGGGGGDIPGGQGSPMGRPGGTVAGGGVAGDGPAGTPGSGSRFGRPGLAGQPGRSGTGGGAVEGGGPDGGAGGSGNANGTSAGSAGNAAAGVGGVAAAGGSGSQSAGGGSLGAGNGASGGSGGQVSLPGMLGAGKAGAGGADGGGAAGGSLANSRGAGWASLATSDRPVPLTRPIRVECALGEFRILDDSGRRIQSRVPIDGDTTTAIDPFVGALHEKVRGWGLAGDRMYWRPELVLTATQDGQSRRDDLERLLADSGIDVRPRGQEPVMPLPPVQRASYNLPIR